jgi:hypothetical protein
MLATCAIASSEGKGRVFRQDEQDFQDGEASNAHDNCDHTLYPACGKWLHRYLTHLNPIQLMPLILSKNSPFPS